MPRACTVVFHVGDSSEGRNSYYRELPPGQPVASSSPRLSFPLAVSMTLHRASRWYQSNCSTALASCVLRHKAPVGSVTTNSDRVYEALNYEVGCSVAPTGGTPVPLNQRLGQPA